jgi:acetoin utilization deacetylase AcuC-like enzyme
MALTAYIWSPKTLTHDTGERVECIARTEALAPTKIRALIPQLQIAEIPVRESMPWIVRVHSPAYVNFVRDICERGGGLLDQGDTLVSGGSFEAAIAAVDSVLTAADLLMAGKVDNAFCAVRPPGHHALPDRAMGFCVFANISILARYLQQHHGLAKVGIVDWDVHHGNGTQDIFYEDSSVLFISLHQFPLWPGTGRASERGRGAGEGFTINIPIAPGTSEAEYLARFEQCVLPAIDDFAPDVLLISAGFDAHRDDPLGGLRLTESGFACMTTQLRAVADRHCKGRIISCLEGGYNLDALQASVVAHVGALTA